MASYVDSVNPLSAEIVLYGEQITAAWRSSVEGVIEAGRLLIAAKAELRHGQFEKMVQETCPFGARTARALMQIGNHSILSNRQHVAVLPNTWGTLAELARFEPKELKHAIANHWVKPDMKREDVKVLRARTQKALGTRSRMPSKNNSPKPRPFAVRLRNEMDERLLEWLGDMDAKTADVIAKRVVGFIAELRKEMTDGQ